MSKGQWIGVFFLHSSEKQHVVWTFDPRVKPCLYYFFHATREIAIERFNELVAISRDNGWTISFTGRPNDPRLS